MEGTLIPWTGASRLVPHCKQYCTSLAPRINHVQVYKVRYRCAFCTRHKQQVQLLPNPIV